jgi:hypothetical protein
MTPHLSRQITTASNFINTDTSISCILDLSVLFIFLNIFFFTYRNSFSFRNSYLYYECEKIILIYESELYSCAQFLLFFYFQNSFWNANEMLMALASYSYLIRRSFLLHFLRVRITTQALIYNCCIKNLCLFWSLQEILLFLVIPPKNFSNLYTQMHHCLSSFSLMFATSSFWIKNVFRIQSVYGLWISVVVEVRIDANNRDNLIKETLKEHVYVHSLRETDIFDTIY